MTDIYKLENWSFGTDAPYQVPEVTRYRLQGEVYNHPDFDDGDRITTSRLVDFDDDTEFTKALAFNESLKKANQCNFIVKSTRKGGHFYFAPADHIPEPAGHTKQNILDYFTGEGHNVIAPTK